MIGLLAGLLVVGALALVLLDSLVRRPRVGMLLTLWMVVISAALDSAATSVEVAGIRVSLSDLGFGLIGLAAVMRLVRRSHLSLGQAAALLLAGMAVLSLMLSVGAGPIEQSVNSFRGYFGFLAALVYFSTVTTDRDQREDFMRIWFGPAIVMAGLVVMRWGGRLAGVDLGVIDESFDAPIRVLDGPESLFVGSSALLFLVPALAPAANRPAREKYLGVVLLIITVLLNRRTLWLAVAAAALLVVIRDPRIGRRVVLAVGVGFALFVASLPLFAGDDGGGAARPVTDASTLLWRAEGWMGLLETGPEEPAHYLIGQPFGSGYDRTVDGRTLESNPHNFYLQTFLRTGIIGLGALVVTLWAAVRGLSRRRTEGFDALTSGHLLVLVVVQLVWYLAWPPGAEQGLLLGLALASTGRLEPTRSRLVSSHRSLGAAPTTPSLRERSLG